MTKANDLESRVESRKRELIAEIIEHKKNSSRSGAGEAIDRLKTKLSDLQNIVKEAVLDGWANVKPEARVRIDEWLAK